MAFASESGTSALVSGALGTHVFMRDRQRGVTALVSHDNEGAAALGDSYRPFISRSGRTLVFETTSTTYDVQASPTDVHLGFAENPLWISAGR